MSLLDDGSGPSNMGAMNWQPNYRMQELERKDWAPLSQAVGDMSKAFEKQ